MPKSEPEPEPQIYFVTADELLSSNEVNIEMNEPNQYQMSTQMDVANEVEVAENSNEVFSTVTTWSHPKGNDSFKVQSWDAEAGKFNFRIVRIREANGTLKRCMQCLICSRVMRTVGMCRVISHR